MLSSCTRGDLFLRGFDQDMREHLKEEIDQ